jgi:S1-C subfamily serine protease
MRFPDWIIYALAIGAIWFVFWAATPRSDTTPALEDGAELGPLLPPPSAFDPEILVDVGPVTSGIGTAFAIHQDGWWLTARHVVDGCDRVGIVVARDTAAEVRDRDIRIARFADLALLRTTSAPVAMVLDQSDRKLRVGQRAFHVGFPQGRSGEAASRLIGRETLVTRGRYEFEQPVLAWAETGRTGGLFGTLAGISGGPAIDSGGRVIGVTLAESSRRGRIYTASPSTVLQLLRVEHVRPEGELAAQWDDQNYGDQADRLRRVLAVAEVICIENNPLT